MRKEGIGRNNGGVRGEPMGTQQGGVGEQEHCVCLGRCYGLSCDSPQFT